MKELRNHIIIHLSRNNVEVGRPASAPRDQTGFFSSSSRGQHLKQQLPLSLSKHRAVVKQTPKDCCSFCSGCRCHMKVNGVDEQGYLRPRATNSVPEPGRGSRYRRGPSSGKNGLVLPSLSFSGRQSWNADSWWVSLPESLIIISHVYSTTLVLLLW
jgi:hypothetical protein